jgi:hypothetical protein
MTSQVSQFVTATVLVQSDHPYQPLLGTDLQSELGFAMVTKHRVALWIFSQGKSFPWMTGEVNLWRRSRRNYQGTDRQVVGPRDEVQRLVERRLH